MKTPKQEFERLHFSLEGLKADAQSRIYDIRKKIEMITLCKSNEEKMLWNRVNEINQLLCATGIALDTGYFGISLESIRERIMKLIDDPDWAGDPAVYPNKFINKTK